MPNSRWVALGSIALLSAGAASCGGSRSDSQVAAASPAAAPASAGGERAPAADGLHGSWVEYWALSGRADTQRYTFLPDGRFGWCAAPGSGAVPARRWGRFQVAADALVLQVQGEDARHDCDGTAACRTVHDPALEQRLPLGACPDNEEARALDAHYRCISVAGQAFWLGASTGNSDARAAALAR